MIDNTKEYILCAAIKRTFPRITSNPYHEGTNDILDIEIGYRHHDIYWRFQGEVKNSRSAQGFYTSKGRFVDRKTAFVIAKEAGQIHPEDDEIRNLFSEDLY